MNEGLLIDITPGVALIPKSTGICRVSVSNADCKNDLSWDRFVRLRASAEAVLQTECKTILDAGGYDGALGFFLTNKSIDLIDPATTDGSILEILANDNSYDAVVAVDVLEHIKPESRALAISELTRVATKYVILNYPCVESNDAQKLVYKLTGNSLIKEHVEFGLPDSDWVIAQLTKHGFESSVHAHTSIAVWIGQYLTQNLAPEAAKEANRHLVEHYSDEPHSKSLYHLIVSKRVV